MGNLIARALAEVRSGVPDQRETFAVAAFIADAEAPAQLQAAGAAVAFDVPPVDPALRVRGNRDLLLAALANLLQNAFKFTHAAHRGHLERLRLRRSHPDRRRGHCGGLPPGRRRDDVHARSRSAATTSRGLGLGLSIARHSIEADGGTLSVRDMPGSGCVFTISLPRQMLS